MEELEELQLNIQEALEEELCLVNKRPSLQKVFAAKSVRDIAQLDVTGPSNTSRSEVLESWQLLVQSLVTHQVFLQYTPSLERFFVHMNLAQDSYFEDVKILLKLMTETVNNHEKDPSTECRYVTLLEVLTTYAPVWKASRQVQRLWDTEGHELVTSISADDFRETAYSLLMSLAWVPNSHGLRQACRVSDEQSVGSVEVPSAIQSVYDQIRCKPLPRHDSIHRILTHLDTEQYPVMAISSNVDDAFHASSRRCHGLGKTTLAAIIASMPQIQSRYSVLWLRLKHVNRESKEMTYQNYIQYLDALCEQLGVYRKWPQPTCVLEERALQKKREEETMFQVKNEMAQLLKKETANLLLILDDVHDDQEIEWFRFQKEQSLLVTTQADHLSVTWTLHLDLLDEEDALELFLTEAKYPSDDILGTSLEVKSIVQRCGYHPLTLRMVARWFSLKEATAGVVKAVEELDQELSMCTAKLRHSHSYKANPEYILTEVLNLTLSPVLARGGHPTMLMKMCFSSATLVFELPTPREAVMLLWGQLLRTEPDAIHELGDKLSHGKLRKRVGFILEALTSLGLVSIVQKDDEFYVDIQHDSLLEYGKSLAKELHFEDEKSETVERWHEAFVVAYLEKKPECELDDTGDDCRIYAIDNLILHMIRAKMFRKAVKLMKDERFLEERFVTKGFEAGTALFLSDCRKLQMMLEVDSAQDKDPFEIVASVYTKVAAYILSTAQGREEQVLDMAGRAVHHLSFALAENGYASEAISQYKSALKLVPKKSAITCVLLYGMSSLNMLRNECSKALKNLDECLKDMALIGNHGVLYAEVLLLKGDALVMARSNYEEAGLFYDQGLEALFSDSTDNQVEIGNGLYRKGMLHYLRGQLHDANRVLGDSAALKVKIGESSASLGGAYYFLGHICAEQNQYDEAIEHFEKALRMMKENLDEVDTADLYLTTGKLCELRDDIDGCLDAFDVALKEIRAFPRLEMDRAVHDLRTIANVYAKHGDSVGALPIFDEGLDLTEKRPGSLARAALLFDMGCCEADGGEFPDAAIHFKASLKIRREKSVAGEVLAETMEKLGAVYKNMGKMDEALKLYNDGLVTTETIYGEDNERVASFLYLLGDLKESMDEHVEALANFEECLELRRRHLEITSVDVADTLERIGSIYVEQRNAEKAYPYYAEALDIRQSISEPEDVMLGDSFHCIGVVARKRGDCERAMHFLLEALHIRKTNKRQRQMCETLFEVGHVHRLSSNPESALGCYEKCLEILHDHFGESDKMVSDVLVSLGHFHRYAGNSEKALECFERALDMRTKMYSSEDTKVATAYWSVGMAKFELDRYEEAKAALDSFIKIQDTNKIKNVDYVIALQVLGDIHSFYDEDDAASSSWSTAFSVYNSSKDMVARYPELGQMVECRLRASKRHSAPPMPESSFFQSISVHLVNHLSEEVKQKAKMERDPAERQFHRAIFLEEIFVSTSGKH